MTTIQRFDGPTISKVKDCYSFNLHCLTDEERRSIKYIEEQIDENSPIPENILIKLDKIRERALGMDREY
jgi:hypothetical protein